MFLNGKFKFSLNNVFLIEVEMVLVFEDIYIIFNLRIDLGEFLSLFLFVFIKMWVFFLKKIIFIVFILNIVLNVCFRSLFIWILCCVLSFV